AKVRHEDLRTRGDGTRGGARGRDRSGGEPAACGDRPHVRHRGRELPEPRDGVAGEGRERPPERRHKRRPAGAADLAERERPVRASDVAGRRRRPAGLGAVPVTGDRTSFPFYRPSPGTPPTPGRTRPPGPASRDRTSP